VTIAGFKAVLSIALVTWLTSRVLVSLTVHKFPNFRSKPDRMFKMKWNCHRIQPIVTLKPPQK